MTKVHVELQRVQSWLFAVPRLRAMVGANVLLGEAIRVHLPNLAREQSSWRLATVPGPFPSAAMEDPLASYDDPASDAKNGILSRDGGHFEVLLESGAWEFAREVDTLLRRYLPGIRFRILVDDDEFLRAPPSNLSTELPVLAPCEWTGRDLASVSVRQGNERVGVSLDVKRRHEAAQRAEEGKALDLASLLVATTKLMNKVRPRDFDDLAGRGYLALVYGDGNGIGRAARSGDVEPGDVERAAFFHRNRVLLRRAVQAAIEAIEADGPYAPLVPLMLGGDDLLVVSRADEAIPFVVRLCRALDEMQNENQSDFRFTLGLGVVVARPSIPIHRLHAVAERLAASAKRYFRALSTTERCSVADWAVYTTTWLDDPEEVRRRDWIRGAGDNLRVLSQRPLRVLGDGLDSLQGLLKAAAALESAPRSQLRYLVDQLPRGRALAELAFAELSKEARAPLCEVGVREVWTSPVGGRSLTSLLDLVEIAEIGRLGRAAAIAASGVGAEGTQR